MEADAWAVLAPTTLAVRLPICDSENAAHAGVPGKDTQEIIGSDWLDENHFDVTAKVPMGATREQIPAMLKNLLAERFKLVSHRETRVLSGYSTVARGGIKAATATRAPVEAAGEQTTGGKPIIGSDGFPALPRSATVAGPVILYRQGRARLQGSETTMMQLAEALSRQLSGVVVDETALSGKYDITLNWIPREGEPGAPPRQPSGTGAESGVTGAAAPYPDIFGAMDQQLGLTLASKRLSREVIVIDRAERTPTEN